MKLRKRITQRLTLHLIAVFLIISLLSNFPTIFVSALTNDTQEMQTSLGTELNLQQTQAELQSTTNGTTPTLYYLRNIGDANLYLNVANGSTQSNTTISTSNYTGDTNQQFYFKKINSVPDTYYIRPQYTDDMFLCATGTSSGATITLNSSTSGRCGFRIQCVGQTPADSTGFTSNIYTIFAEAGNYETALCADANTHTVTHKTFSTMSEANMRYAQWVLEPVISETVAPSHEYHAGVVEGSTYYLRNVGDTNYYMDVTNGSLNLFTTVYTRTYTGNTNQQFRFEYMGDNTYRIAPVYADTMYLCVDWYDSGSPLSLYNIPDFWGDYRLRCVGETNANNTGASAKIYEIYTEAGDYDAVVCASPSQSRTVMHKTYSTMSASEKLYAQWVLEPVSNTQTTKYSKYYIRHELKNVYLDVSNPTDTVVHAAPFSGTESQMWKKTVAFSQRYYLSTMSNLYDNLAIIEDEVGTSGVGLYDDLSHMQFYLENAGLDSGGRATYTIAAYFNGVKKYLNLGSLVEGTTDTYYVVFSNHPDGNQSWIFEEIPIDTPNTQATQIYTNYTSIISNFKEKQVYVLPTGSYATRYFLRFFDHNQHNITIVESSGQTSLPYYQENTVILDSTDNSTVRIYDMILMPHSYYYFIISSDSLSNYIYEFEIDQFSLSAHLGVFDVSGQHEIISTGLNLSWPFFNRMGWNISSKEGISSDEAKTALHSATGTLDFQSDVFIYNGHGAPGRADYDYMVTSTYLSASEIPNMQGCQLAIWASCESAQVSNNTSLVSASIQKGAGAAIGWAKPIVEIDLRIFLNTFWDEILAGKSIAQAQAIALNKPKCTCTTSAEYDNNQLQKCTCDEGGICLCSECPCNGGDYTYYHYAYGIVDSLVMMGNTNYVLHPITTNTTSTTNIISNTEIASIMFDKSEYVLMAESDSLGVKLYSKLLNGIPTDDCYLEYYKNGVLIDTYKSEYTLDDSVIQSQSIQDSTAILSDSTIAKENLAYSYVNGEWHLIEKRTIATTHEGHECTTTAYIDLTETRIANEMQ